MGYRIETNNKDKWVLYDTKVEEIILECETEEELKRFLALDKVYKAKIEAIELLMTYPNRWTVNEVRVFNTMDFKLEDNYLEWIRELYNTIETYEDYYRGIDAKLEELLK